MIPSSRCCSLFINSLRYFYVGPTAESRFKTLSTINWNRDATGAFEEEPTKEHGRIECRRIQTMTPLPGTVNFPHIAQIFRIERDREMCKSGKKSTEIAYGITSVPKDRGTPENLLAWNRGHWSVENRNHRARDVNFREDACVGHTTHGPSNGAICNNIALAIILSRGPKIELSFRKGLMHFVQTLSAFCRSRIACHDIL